MPSIWYLPPGRRVVRLEGVADRADADDDERHEVHEEVAERDDDARRQRQLGAKAGEQRRERRDDLPQNDADHEHGDHDDGDRIDHRRLHLALQLDRFLDVGREPLENRVENTARLARRDHVGEQRIERLRVLLHGVGQRRAAFDVRPGREDRLGEVLVFLLAAQNLEALHERQAGVDHDGELADEDRQVLRIDLLAELALLGWRGGRLLLGRRDARDEHLLAAQRRDDGIGVVGDALAVDGFSAACAARISKCRHNLSFALFADSLVSYLPHVSTT